MTTNLNKQQKKDYLKWIDKTFCLEAVKRNGDAYIYVEIKIAKVIFEGLF